MVEESNTAKYFAEFLGTFVLVLTIGCNALSGQQVWAGVSIAAALMVMIYALGSTSGANFNPAVSLALGINKSLEWDVVFAYMGAQFAGGILGGIMYMSIFMDSFKLGPTWGHTMWQAALAEIFYTFMLVFVILNVAVSKKHSEAKDQFYGIAIGSVIIAGAYSGGSISMGCFNPAVAVGIDITSGHMMFRFHSLLYMIFEFLGAVLAVIAFWVVRPDEPNCAFKVGEMVDGDYPIQSRLASEFIGTFILVLTIGLNVLSDSKAAVLSIAASLMCMVFALGSVSGAHFNPAVTTAVMVAGRNKIHSIEGAMYMGMQVLGGVCAAFTYTLMMGGRTFELKPATSSWPQALAAELCFTFVLAFVVLSVATVKEGPSQYFGLAIGGCVMVGGCAIGKISGGSLNPAVSIGVSAAHVMGGGFFWPCIMYSLIEVCAGAAAAFAFQVSHPSEYPKDADGKAHSLFSYGSYGTSAMDGKPQHAEA